MLKKVIDVYELLPWDKFKMKFNYIFLYFSNKSNMREQSRTDVECQSFSSWSCDDPSDLSGGPTQLVWEPLDWTSYLYMK